MAILKKSRAVKSIIAKPTFSYGFNGAHAPTVQIVMRGDDTDSGRATFHTLSLSRAEAIDMAAFAARVLIDRSAHELLPQGNIKARSAAALRALADMVENEEIPR